ncbi:MAG: alkaline phosphatase [Gemmatimonadetes bacterium]|nr:alkaline phosphatase [Gemmatimonadota bacterium]NIQ54214.1 alkaline phosphatase [Gemmatimonadota bacterium]NIU74417.1 alkaline phosphatase [Gammaproteobacteria bacterium]NIX44403.1 alkaline phosphatase [Gemmatimonadota bacterium]NIY08619.1 alkaline phosphatase [Gemmatimonadota bacterium]
MRSRPPARARIPALLVALLAIASCAGGPPGLRPLVDVVTFTGAGDIAVCGGAGDDATAAMLDTIPGIIWTTGDNAYPSGSPADFARCYDASWGRHRERTRPTPGNHEYWTPNATGYFQYFGAQAGEAGKGWYSYRYGHWLVVALNTNVPAGRGSEQIRWLDEVLEENPTRCAVAYFHHPLVSSGAHGASADVFDDADVRPIWDRLHDAGVDIVLAGHEHHYERFAPLSPRGRPDPDGIRQFIVGTGGAVLRGRGERLHPQSQLLIEGHHGVLRLSLGDGGYAWRFVATDGRVMDSGRDLCH